MDDSGGCRWTILVDVDGRNIYTHLFQTFIIIIIIFSVPVLVSEMAENIHYYAENSLSVNWIYFRTVLSFLNVILISVITFLILKRPLRLSSKTIKL